MRRVKLLLVAVLACGGAGAAPSRLLPDEQNNVDIYHRCNPGVVNITTVTLKRDFFFDVVPQQGTGSGAILRADGFIATNNHVVGDAQKVEVTLHDKSSYPAVFVGADPDSDLAVIRIDTQGKKLVPLELGKAGELAVGQKVLAIGNPFGLGGSLSVGIISSLGRDIRATTDRLIKDVIQTDAAINPGNSGGPLLDSAGRIIGINAQIFSQSGGSEGIGFAISIDTVARVTSQLIEYGRVLRPELGMYGVGLSPAILAGLNIPGSHGVMVTELDPRGLAAKAGLRAADRELVFYLRRIPVGGDLVTHIDSTAVASLRDILDYMVDKKEGQEITVRFLRNRVSKEVRIKLALAKPRSRRGKSL